jgi:UTP--glucose-1-phosphate uridylyltransferase
MIKQAIIPLAGQGTRLLPLTSVFPKELLPINGKPAIEYILDECIKSGIKEIILII